MLPHEGKHAAHSIAQEHGQPRNPARWRVDPTKTPNQFSSTSCASTAKRTGLPSRTPTSIRRLTWSRQPITPLYGTEAPPASYSCELLQHRQSFPQIRDISTLTSAPKPVRIPSMNSMAPTLKIQVSKKPFAETMTTPPEGDVLADRSLCLEHGSLSDLILHPSCE